MNWFREAIKKKTQRKILKALEKQNLTFEQLLKEAKISRSTLAIHLKELLKNGKIERFYNTYRLTRKGIVETQIESMIHYLGIVATHHIIKTKLNLPVEFGIKEEIEGYMKEEPENVSWKELFEFLEKEYPLIIGGRKK